MKKRKRGKGLLWIIVICIFVLLGFYFRGQITSKLSRYATRAHSVSAAKSDKPATETARPKSQTVSSIKGRFTFSPDGGNRTHGRSPTLMAASSSWARSSAATVLRLSA